MPLSDSSEPRWKQEDPLSKCMHTDHPCVPGGPCVIDPNYPCEPGCGDYASYNEDDPSEDR